MQYKHSLRIRITVTFFLFGTFLMAAVATGVHYAIEQIEEQAIQDSLDKELQSFRQRYLENPDLPLPNSANMKAYLISPGHTDDLPDYMRTLQPGTYEIKHNGKILEIIVGKLNGKELALEVDATFFERRENSMNNALIIAVIVASLLALWIGYALSQRAIAPVTSLAKAVSILDPAKPADRLAEKYVNDEVGELALAFDRYLERLQDFVTREQEFTGNASHELRTPLTIIKGAVEILNADPELSARSHGVLQRIKRATDSMSQMVETLLVLAREDKVTDHPVASVASVAQAIIAENKDLLGDRPVKLEMMSVRDFALQVPSAVLIILLGNLLRNAIAFTKEGGITITVNSPSVLVTDTGKGITEEELPKIFERHYRSDNNESTGSGIGLSIVKRICDHYGWTINVTSTPESGTVVTVDFAKSVTSPS